MRMKNIFADKIILVTGGVGTIGRRLVLQLLTFNPAAIRILDVDESTEFELEQELKSMLSDSEFRKIRFFIGNVRDLERLKRAIQGVDIVFHLAALKHVTLCEYNPSEAVKTNVIGIQNIINASIDEGVEKFIFTSSDKAANPTNMMGATKLLGEKLVISANRYKGHKKCIFSSVRFGNVINSRGSVIPLWKKQLESDKALTITNKDMTRFMMSIQDTTNFLLKATELARGGEVFVSKMPSIHIGEMAQAFIKDAAPKYGKDPKDIKQNVIGLRSGEKMYEELMTDEEVTRSLETDTMFVILPPIKELMKDAHLREIGAHEVTSQEYNSHKMQTLSPDELLLFLRNSDIW
jgi:UDP-N-acetylglucosamine 4,6-dehydratase/5-epimerase